eukprot:gnl/MRDRNA2_/MRDRNA2_99808_c0_seq1.p1 gnl/MRDRNA2_/MRDRNA2_99808_c0~~gnl/MRDRNA2_/MRDRNA2_99808_c0_seq1.p1  ORF type:complete len:216 (+),score=33.50 gnl/MRDRNA2_/MRDRNA2_99808_c0_seq1:60-707(+)
MSRALPGITRGVRNLYTVLGVTQDAPRSAIKKRFKDLAMKTHPDMHHGTRNEALANDAFEEVQYAYKVLYDPDRRRVYDAQISGKDPAGTADPDDQPEPRSPGPAGPSSIPKAGAYRQSRAETKMREIPVPSWMQNADQDVKYKGFSKEQVDHHWPWKLVLGAIGAFAVFRGLPMVLMMNAQDNAAYMEPGTGYVPAYGRISTSGSAESEKNPKE